MQNNCYKKIIIILITFLLLNTSYFLSNTKQNYVSAQDFKSLDTNIKSIILEMYPTMAPIPLVKFQYSSNNVTINVIETPSEFSWKDNNGKDWTTPAKHQGDCGSCWLFASLGVFESIINIKENCAELDPDLSEQYVLSCMPMAGSCNGGNVDNCVYYFIKNTSSVGNYRNGVITEEYFNYESSFDYIPPCSDKLENWEIYLIPILDYEESWNYYNISGLKDTIKSLVYQKGPILVYHWASERFINWGIYNRLPSQYYRDFNEEIPYFVNHAIMVIGWKDDPEIGNGGYWICKNSWGENWGYDGFFNIEYDCLNLGGFISWVDYDPESYDWGPIAPTINGPINGRPFEEYEYSFHSIDPDGESDLYYYINWDDGTLEEWIGPYKTGETIYIKHTYEEDKNYNIRVKTKDINGKESRWSILEFSMTKSIEPAFPIIYWFFEKLLERLPTLETLFY